MTKILLVEDDKSLREIYSVRLLAEGYTLISSGDGEEALAVAIGEKPDLIVSDVMMPKISGFEMLDLLRSNDSTKNIPIIMLTALSSEKQRERGNRLGADRYLIKSQVGIEDIVRTVHEVLNDGNPRSISQLEDSLGLNGASDGEAKPEPTQAESTDGQTDATKVPENASADQATPPAVSDQPDPAESSVTDDADDSSSGQTDQATTISAETTEPNANSRLNNPGVSNNPFAPSNHQSAFNPLQATNPDQVVGQASELPDRPLKVPSVDRVDDKSLTTDESPAPQPESPAKPFSSTAITISPSGELTHGVAPQPTTATFQPSLSALLVSPSTKPASGNPGIAKPTTPATDQIALPPKPPVPPIPDQSAKPPTIQRASFIQQPNVAGQSDASDQSVPSFASGTSLANSAGGERSITPLPGHISTGPKLDVDSILAGLDNSAATPNIFPGNQPNQSK
ncbi:MAG: response regulator [Candidatus Nanoperiomorbus sp.]